MNTAYLYNVELEDQSVQIYYYERLRSKMYSVRNYLKESLNNLNNVYSPNSDLTIDESCSINFDEVSEEISSRINYLDYTIIPAIQQKINSLK